MAIRQAAPLRSFFLFMLLLSAVSSFADVIYGEYKPTGIVQDGVQSVTWKVTPTDGYEISEVDLSLNGQPVKATYDQKEHLVTYKPETNLGPGFYKVNCRATVVGKVTVRQDWSFEISQPGSNTSIASQLAFDEVNLIRRELGLPPFSTDKRVSDAAMAHSRYMAANQLCGHVEEPGKSGYTGRQPWDRIQAFGYQGVCYEDACFGIADPRQAVRSLFDAPYHRIAFLQPGSTVLGAGMIDGALTADFVLSPDCGVSYSPASGQTGVPVAWDGNETPSPLRVHGVNAATGYPIVFGYYSPQMETIRVTKFQLIDPEGSIVAGYLNTPANDSMLRFSAVFIPSQALFPATTYSVVVKGSTRGGKCIDSTWKFTTKG